MPDFVEENDRVVKIFEDGELVWSDEDYIQRPKIGDKTGEILRKADSIKDIKHYLARIHNIDLEV